MKQEIIAQMAQELSGSKWCKGDFEHDKKSLKDYNEQFFWMVRKDGTSLCKVGVSKMIIWKQSEAARFILFRDKYNPIGDIKYWADYCDPDTTKYFYYDGFKLFQLSMQDIVTTFDNIFNDFYDKMIEEYKEEYDLANTPLTIKFGSSKAKEAWSQADRLARDLEDDSFCNCLDNLRKHARIAKNQFIMLYSDFEENSLSFCEMVNDECLFQGGIIYSSHKDSDRWAIHT